MQPNSHTTAVAVVPPPQQAVVVQDSPYMPSMTMQVALARRTAIVEFTKQIMVRDHDFGEIPGTNKPTLLKPGAEKLCSFFGFEPNFEISAETRDWTGATTGGEPLYYIAYKCKLMKYGVAVGVGEGSCNSWEQKYRYRWVPENMLPPGIDKSTLMSRGGMKTFTEFDFAIDKAETGGKYGKPAEYWEAFRTAIQNGTAKRVRKPIKSGGEKDAWSIEMGQQEYRIPNPDFADLINTIQKMAQKRALVAATLIATNASEFYTQDVEDLPQHDDSAAVAAQYGVQAGTKEAAQQVAQQKIAQQQQQQKQEPQQQTVPWRDTWLKRALQANERLGSPTFYRILGEYGFEDATDITDRNAALTVWNALTTAINNPPKVEEPQTQQADPEDRDSWVPENIGGAQ